MTPLGNNACTMRASSSPKEHQDDDPSSANVDEETIVVCRHDVTGDLLPESNVFEEDALYLAWLAHLAQRTHNPKCQ